MKKFETGLCSVSFRPLSAEQIVRLAADAGLEAIEWGSDVHAKPDDPARLREIAAMTADAGLRVSSYGSYFRIGGTPEEELGAYIRAAKLLGTDIVRVWAGDRFSGEYSEEEAERFFALCRRLAARAEDEGVILCTERHVHTFTDRRESVVRMLDAVGSPNFRTYYQPDQFTDEEENVRLARDIADRTVHLHVFQWKGSGRYPLSDGIEEWRRYLSFFDGGSLLLEFMPDDDPKKLRREADSLRTILEGLR